MSISSSPFGPVILTGEDAVKFAEQIANAPPNPAAEESLRRGLELVRQFRRDGKVTLTPRG